MNMVHLDDLVSIYEKRHFIDEIAKKSTSIMKLDSYDFKLHNKQLIKLVQITHILSLVLLLRLDLLLHRLE